MKHKVLVVGSFVQDLTFSTQEFPRPGETVVGEFLTGPGGKGSNQAVAACRSGSSCTFVGAVGEDAFAESVRKFYQKEGIQAPLAVYPEANTGTAGILFDATGQNEIVVALGANDLIQPNDVPDELIRSTDLVVCQLECNLETVENILERAQSFGKRTILNPAPLRPELRTELLDHCDVLIPNESEFCAVMKLSGLGTMTTEELAELDTKDLDMLCRKLGPETVLVTLGKNGVHVSHPGGAFHIPALEGIQVVDTTGAGDAFVGAFASAYLRFNRDLKKATRFANTAAALSVTRKGTAPAMATKKEIERWIANNE